MPTGLLDAYSIKRPAFVFGLDDLIAIKGRPDLRLTATPFVHDYENKVFLGGAVGWKGVKGIEAVRDKNEGVAAGLEKAIKVSQACEGVKGSVRVGDRYLPKKVLCQIEKAS